MRRVWMRRTGAALLVMWTIASVAERAVLDHCPQHDPFSAAVAEHNEHATHGGTHGHSNGGPHHCGCLDQCAAATALALPATAVRLSEIARVPNSAAPRALETAAPAHPGIRLPFANGPPYAVIA